MSWVKIDDRAPEHRKQLAAGPVACWLWVCGLAYANRQEAHDGFIPSAALPMLLPIGGVVKHAEKLVTVGLWERADGGYRIHDYLDYQPSAEAVSELRAKRSEAGRRGGLRSGATRKQLASAELSNGEASCFSTVEAKTNPDPDPDPDPEREREGDTKTPVVMASVIKLLDTRIPDAELERRRHEQLRALAEFETNEATRARRKA